MTTALSHYNRMPPQPANCALCNEPMGFERSASVVQEIHRACALRSVVGGIGHVLDHERWCIERNDPDAGLDYRTSALLVDELIVRKRIVDPDWKPAL